MKMISIVNVFAKLVMVLLIFLIIKSKQDAYLVPIVYSFGFLIGGIVSLYDIIIHMKIKLIKPTFEKSWFYVKDSLSVFSTDLVCTIKDKLSYLLIGTYVGMSDVVIYDLGLKLHGIAAKPYMMICTVMFPRLAKTRNVNQLKRVAIISLSFTIILVVIANVFLSDIVLFFLHEHCDLIPLRLFLMGPLILSVSYVISNNMFVAFGYNKYMFKSILVTTIVYIFCLVVLFLTHHMNTIMAFICIALISYAAELIYRLIKALQIIKIEKKIISMKTVLLVASTLGRDGTSQFITYFINNMSNRRDLKIKVLFFRQVPDEFLDRFNERVDISSLNIQGALYKSYLRILKRIIEIRPNYCLLGFHQLVLFSFLRTFLHLFKIKILIRDTIIPSLFHKEDSTFKKYLVRTAYKKFDYIIAQSNDMKSDLINHWECDPKK